MSGNDNWLPVEEHKEPWPWEQTRDEAAQFLNAAADRLEMAACDFQSEWFWQRETRRADLSVGAANWARMVGPAIAPFLVGQLRAAASSMASVCMADEIPASTNPNVFGLASHIMAVRS
ncbi:hypothetical protein [Kutzneria albida]|uniref:Uncharacterized protein n=1 Tax=Kutzneria albida DSM 43870 TaxID=1449976 RepID=W5WJ76_9PSEU|nr:hypothetical protein [Kutzneria albida]AHH98214.1 hypothetical protein KALB_4852 [Kutzneria albida DSM 43870]